ncbi:unnamed protein product [Auanema sp. JU1783]|nr:unnamed protein product [Auanema sp. JU1783]
MIPSFTRTFSSTTKVVKKVNCAVYGSGLSASGALGIPNLVVNNKVVKAREQPKPTRITYLNTLGINKISAGFGFSLFASNSKLFGAGLNNRFQVTTQLGKEGVQDYYISCKKLALPENVKILSISSGRAHSLVATNVGLFAFGDNCHGQCGVNPEIHSEVFGTAEKPLPLVNIPSEALVTSVHCALDTSFAVTSKGEVFAFGLNEDGQCSNGSYGIQFHPSLITGDASDVPIVEVSGSSDTIFGLSKEGEAFIWGQCEYNQAGEGLRDVQLNVSRRLPFNLGNVTSIGSSTAAVVASNSEGQVYVWGVGLLGLGPSVQRLVRPTMMDQPLFNNKKVTQVYGGNTGMCAINEEGTCFSWGQNRYGLLALGHYKDQYFPFQVSVPGDVKTVAIGPDHALVLMK